MKTEASLLSRRTFLRQGSALAGVAFGGPLIAPASVLGAGGAVAPSNRITIGFIGTGRQAVYANIPGFLREPDAQAVAVCDVDSWRLANARKQVEEMFNRRWSSINQTISGGGYRDPVFKFMFKNDSLTAYIVDRASPEAADWPSQAPATFPIGTGTDSERVRVAGHELGRVEANGTITYPGTAIINRSVIATAPNNIQISWP